MYLLPHLQHTTAIGGIAETRYAIPQESSFFIFPRHVSSLRSCHSAGRSSMYIPGVVHRNNTNPPTHPLSHPSTHLSKSRCCFRSFSADTARMSPPTSPADDPCVPAPPFPGLADASSPSPFPVNGAHKKKHDPNKRVFGNKKSKPSATYIDETGN